MTSRKLQAGRQLALDELFRLPTTAVSMAIDDSFPEAFADKLSRCEAFNKHLFRPNTYLHKWWARRCGSTFRTILKQFAPDPARRDYYAAGGLEGKIVLDPMIGGGTTLHEAIRLGANVIGADIDPIPIVQARAALTEARLADLQTAFDSFFDELYQRLGRYFQTECPACAKTLDSHYTLHGLRKHCACAEVVQIEQYELRQEADRTLRIWPDTWEITDDHDTPVGPTKPPRLITKAETICPQCHQKYQDVLGVPFYARYVPVAVVSNCAEHGLFFRAPSAADLERIARADAQRAAMDFAPIEHFAVQHGSKSGDLLRRHVHSYLDLFSSRQLLYLYHAIDCLRPVAGAVRLNLALLVSTSLELNAMLCGYKGWFKRRPGAIRHVFGLHAYAFQYTVAENNPVNREKSSGNLQRLFHDRIARGRKWALAPEERKIDWRGDTQVVKIPGEFDGGTEVFRQSALRSGTQKFWLLHSDSRRLPVADESVDIIVTDPPYYDSVQYSNLATFFRVWLAHLLPDELNWLYEEAHSAVAVKGGNGETNFGRVMSGIFQECGRVLKRGAGRMVFTFHHWDPNAWAELTLALRHAGFRLMSAYAVFSEHPISVHINNLNSLKHDAILVLASARDVPAGRWSPLTVIDASDSETFCRQCSAALGWLLESDCSPDGVRAAWKNLIPKRG